STIKTAFGTKGSNRKRYRKLRPQAADPIAQVEQLLLNRGRGTVRQDCMEDIEEAWSELHAKLLAADTKYETNPAKAFKMLFKLVEPARTLLVQANQAYELAEQQELDRIGHEADFRQSLNTARGLLQSILDAGGDKPEPISTNLDNAEDLLRQFTESDAYDQAKEVLDGIVSNSLTSLAKYMTRAASLNEQIARTVSQENVQQATQLYDTVKTAVAQSQVDQAKQALKAFQEGLRTLQDDTALETMRQERTRELQRMSQLDPRDVYKRYHLKIEDIRRYPRDYASPTVKQHQTAVRQADKKFLAAVKLLEEAERDLKKVDEDSETGTLFARMDVESALLDANKALDVLKKALEDAGKPMAEHDGAVRKYYAALKKLNPRITFARALPQQAGGVDTAWKAERIAFDNALAAVKTEVDPPKRDYARGLPLLTTLETKINELSTARTNALNADVNTATDATHGSAQKSKALVDQLMQTPGLIREMQPQQQLKLLKSLREQLCFCKDCDQGFDATAFKNNNNRCPNKEADGVTDCNSVNVEIPAVCSNIDCLKPGIHSTGSPCPDCGNDDWWLLNYIRESFTYNDSSGIEVTKASPTRDLFVARAKMFTEMKLTPEFEQHDQQKRRETTLALRQDPMFEEAQENWSDWVDNNNTAKIEAFFNQAIKLQCRILGHNQQGLTREVPEGSGTIVDFPDVPVKVRLDTPNPPKPGLYGYCEPGFPTFIAINTTCRQFGDFKEQVDTIVHENAHAFQGMLVKKLKAEAPFDNNDKQTLLNDPNLGVQAQLFLENSESYVQNDTLQNTLQELELSHKAYRHEPFEEHSWTTGGTISKSLLVPPQIESFESRRTMRSKMWMVKEVTREADCTITLTERHGIYVDEWEGEMAGDKTLSLENIKKGGIIRSKRVKILDVLNEKQLQVDLDTSTYDPVVKLKFDDQNPKSPVINQGTDDTKVAGESMRLILDERIRDL
ncbi:MAG: hypothetical protein H6739_41815, partial [Alphaproteobacteria bacterium]|nr:hypothetical protein [Alphaproteobacteria bacterium]